nr:ABC transporter permease [Acidobacteriota bacterium]
MGDTGKALLILFGIVTLVLLIACANVANLLLASASGRQQELSVRGALGADRAMLIRQLLTESLMLAVLGGLLGLALAFAGVKVLTVAAPDDIPRLAEVGIDPWVIAFTLGVSLLTLLVIGLIPAFQATRIDLRGALIEGGGGGSTRGRQTHHFMAVLVGAETAMAVVLLVGAGLLVASFRRLQAIELGFRPDHLLTAEVVAPPWKYKLPQQQENFYLDLTRRLGALPGVRSVALVLLRPLQSDIGWDYPFAAFGQSPEERKANPYVNFETVSPGYFKTLGVRMIDGRDFADTDVDGAPPVAIVSESLARRYWPNESAVGKRIRNLWAGRNPPPERAWRTVVGTVAAVRYRGLQVATLDVYLPYRQLLAFAPPHVLL